MFSQLFLQKPFQQHPVALGYELLKGFLSALDYRLETPHPCVEYAYFSRNFFAHREHLI